MKKQKWETPKVRSVPKDSVCQIKWIDCNGDATPDENPAVGVAVYTSAVSEVVNRWRICAEHLKSMGKVHHDPKCVHKPSQPELAKWTFEPYPRGGGR